MKKVRKGSKRWLKKMAMKKIRLYRFLGEYLLVTGKYPFQNKKMKPEDDIEIIIDPDQEHRDYHWRF